jgi:hypothetical protein
MSTKQLVCPKCRSDDLAGIEDLMGHALGGFVEDSTGTRRLEPSGTTDVLWDTSATVGVICLACYWKSEPLTKALAQLRYAESEMVCPLCGNPKRARADLCGDCRRRQRARPDARPEQIGDERLAAAYARWMAGAALLDVATGLLDAVPHLTAQQLAEQLRHEFRRRGWPSRTSVEQPAA